MPPFSLARRRDDRRVIRELTRQHKHELSLSPSDNISRVHLPAYLQSVSIGFTNPTLIAERLCPTVAVEKQSDKYRIFGRNMFRTAETRWRPGSIPNAVTFRWSDDQYFCEQRKLRIPLFDQERSNADVGLDLEMMYTETVTNAIDIGRESRVATLFTTAANYASTNKLAKSGGSEWDQSSVISTQQPILDMQSMIEVAAQSAMVPSNQLTVVIPRQTYDLAIKNNTAIIDRLKYTSLGVVTTDLLRALLDVKEVIIGESMTAGQAPETADSDVITGYTTTYLWGDTVWIGLVAAGQNMGAPWFARTFGWTGMDEVQSLRSTAAITGGSPSEGMRVVRMYRMEDEGKEGDWIEVKEARSEKIGAASSGCIITNTLSTV